MTTVRKQVFVLFLIIAMVAPSALWAAPGNELVDLDMVTRIRQEGFHHSQVMLTLSELTDRIGPRVTGSPNMKKANEWSKDLLTKWGLVNAHLENWSFGRGWQEEFTSVRMVSPDIAMLNAIPRAWTPGTNGAVRGKVTKIKIEKKEDIEKYRGKLAGMIVLTGDMRDVKPQTDPVTVRLDEQKLEAIAQYQVPGERGGERPGTGGPMNPEEMRRRMELGREVSKFLIEEKPLAVIEPSRYDVGMVTMSGTNAYKAGENVGVPTLNMAIEHYGRISRLLDRDVPVELEVNVQTKFYDDDLMSYNTIAEIPGTDKKDEIVILGGHMDSWHGGTGATDNAAGVAACMEAMRILKALGVKPRRTIRIALWSGEEQGLLGSRAYVAQHFAARPEPPKDAKDADVPAYMRRPTGPLQFKPEWAKVAAYFNIDNGTGKLRGIYTQENAAVRPIFEAWIEPLKDLGVTTVTMRNTGGTDHQSFDGVGLPGFQFIQDPVEYFSKTHHTNMDVYERLQREDLMQQAVVMATFVYEAAMRDQPLPRKALSAEDQPPATPARATSASK